MSGRIPGENLTLLAAYAANALASVPDTDAMKMLAVFLSTVSSNLFLIANQRDQETAEGESIK